MRISTRHRPARLLALPAASLAIACWGPTPAPVSPQNQSPAPRGPHLLAPNCVELERGELERAFGDLEGMAAAATLRWYEGGKVPGLDKGKAWPGVAISEIRPGSIYDRMGLRDGDIVYAINGYAVHGAELVITVLSDPEVAAEAAAGPGALADIVMGSSSPDSLSLAIVRGGAAISINQVFEGTPVTACEERPALREEAAAQATWSEAEWQADAARRHEEAERRAKEEAAVDAMRQRVIGGITKINDTTFTLASAITVEQLKQLLTISRGARLVQAIKGGKLDGAKIYAVWPTSLHAALGLANGDKLTAVSGVTVTSLEQVIEELARLPEAAKPSITLTRRGTPMTLVFTIK